MSDSLPPPTARYLYYNRAGPHGVVFGMLFAQETVLPRIVKRLSCKWGKTNHNGSKGDFPTPTRCGHKSRKENMSYYLQAQNWSWFSSGNKKERKMAAVVKTKLAENEFALSCPVALRCCALMKNKTLLRLIQFSRTAAVKISLITKMKVKGNSA